MSSRLSVERCRCIQLIHSFFVILGVQLQPVRKTMKVRNIGHLFNRADTPPFLPRLTDTPSAPKTTALFFDVLRPAFLNAESMLSLIPGRDNSLTR